MKNRAVGYQKVGSAENAGYRTRRLLNYNGTIEAQEEFKNALIVCLNSKSDKAVHPEACEKIYKEIKVQTNRRTFANSPPEKRCQAATNWWRWKRNMHKWKMDWVDMGGHAALEKLEALRARNMHCSQEKGSQTMT